MTLSRLYPKYANSCSLGRLNPDNIFGFSPVFMEDHCPIVDLSHTYVLGSISQGLAHSNGSHSNMAM
jgi:hypothetical protein